NATKRDIELQVSKNAKVTILNPTDLVADDSNVIDDTDDTNYTYNSGDTPAKKNGNTIANNDGVVILDNVNLRKYHSTAMRVLVTSEDGKTKTEYRLTFKGTPSGTPSINSITFHDTTNNVNITSTKDKDGNLIVHVPYAQKPAGGITGTDFVGKFDKISVDTSDGATVFNCACDNAAKDCVHITDVPTNEMSTSSLYVYDTGAAFGLPNGCSLAYIFEAIYDSETTAQTPATKPTFVYIYFDDAKTTANITDITLTEKNELVDAVGNKLPGKVNPNNKTIRIDVPYSF
ncbi:hypothetical protein, partial [Acutalibacter sp. 1XD8-36]|uniref:hypothetical protein n=1 Tax=Acutalibacter sp. 1XD8-36 TaxID=2320852 RepID=UPI0014134DD9